MEDRHAEQSHFLNTVSTTTSECQNILFHEGWTKLRLSMDMHPGLGRRNGAEKGEVRRVNIIPYPLMH